MALTFWSWVVSWHGCGWREGWGFWPKVFVFFNDGGCQDVFPGLWSLAFLLQTRRLCYVPPGPWLHCLCCFLQWHLYFLILTPFFGVQENLAVFQGHARAPRDSWVPRALAFGKTPLTALLLLQLTPRDRDAGAGWKRHFCESPVAFSQMTSPILPPCKILWKRVVRQEKLALSGHIFS